METTNLVFGIGMLLALAGNLLWYRIKQILKRKGYEVSYFWGHLQDLSNFNAVIQQEPDQQRKRKYETIRGSLNVVIVLFVCLAIYLVIVAS